MSEVYLQGAASTRFGRRSERLLALAAEAARGAADGADPARLIFATQHAEAFEGVGNPSAALADALGLAPRGATRVESGPSAGASAIEVACFAIASGAIESALVVGAERMSGVSTADATRELAKMISPRDGALGTTMPTLAARAARAYVERHRVTREALASVPVKAHAHGARNPLAHFQKTVTVDDVLRAPVVAAPLTVLDCAPISDGASAVFLSSKPGPVRVAGVGHATDAWAVADRGDEGLLSFRATREAAAEAFRASRRTPSEVHVAEVHDAFSVLEALAIEDLGFVPRGEGVASTARGETSLGGRLPVNVTGGLKARGHPTGASGVAQVVDLYRQLTRSAGAVQVDGARVALAHSVGGFGTNVVVTVLEVV